MFALATARLGGEKEQWRQPRRIDGPNVREAGIPQPATDFLQREGVAVVGVHQHVRREDQGRYGPSPVSVDEDFGDGDRAAGGERVERLSEQFTAAFLAFAVNDVPQGRYGVSAAKIRLVRSAPTNR